jgi:hypothetical protein
VVVVVAEPVMELPTVAVAVAVAELDMLWAFL